MSGGVRDDVAAAAGHDPALMSEVRHATANLVHRMRYWAELLGQQELESEGTEALSALRTSIDGLHELLGRTMDLLRPRLARPIPVPARDLVHAVALRFGADAEATLSAIDLDDEQAEVDPAVLQHALSILTELAPVQLERNTASGASTRDAFVATSPLMLAVEREGHACTLTVAVARRSPASSDATASVAADVSLALAAKLLADTGCSLVAAGSELLLRIPVRRAIVRTTATA